MSEQVIKSEKVFAEDFMRAIMEDKDAQGIIDDFYHQYGNKKNFSWLIPLHPRTFHAVFHERLQKYEDFKNSKKYILVVKNKYDTSYYNMETVALANKSVMSILQQNLEAGYYLKCDSKYDDCLNIENIQETEFLLKTGMLYSFVTKNIDTRKNLCMIPQIFSNQEWISNPAYSSDISMAIEYLMRKYYSYHFWNTLLDKLKEGYTGIPANRYNFLKEKFGDIPKVLIQHMPVDRFSKVTNMIEENTKNNSASMTYNILRFLTSSKEEYEEVEIHELI